MINFDNKLRIHFQLASSQTSPHSYSSLCVHNSTLKLLHLLCTLVPRSSPSFPLVAIPYCKQWEAGRKCATPIWFLNPAVDSKTYWRKEMRGLRTAGDSLGGYSWERGKGGVEAWTDQSLLKLMPFPVPLYICLWGEWALWGEWGEDKGEPYMGQ